MKRWSWIWFANCLANLPGFFLKSFLDIDFRVYWLFRSRRLQQQMLIVESFHVEIRSDCLVLTSLEIALWGHHGCAYWAIVMDMHLASANELGSGHIAGCRNMLKYVVSLACPFAPCMPRQSSGLLGRHRSISSVTGTFLNHLQSTWLRHTYVWYNSCLSGSGFSFLCFLRRLELLVDDALDVLHFFLFFCVRFLFQLLWYPAMILSSCYDITHRFICLWIA